MANHCRALKRDRSRAPSSRTLTTCDTSKLFNMRAVIKEPNINIKSAVDIVINSEASEHVGSDQPYLRETQQVAPRTVELANSESFASILKEKLDMDTGITLITITDAYCIPGVQLKIISCSRLDERGD